LHADLSGLLGTQFQVTLEIQVDRPEGFDNQTVRVVSENASTLKFDGYGFEEE
jgi:hypothetical protein